MQSKRPRDVGSEEPKTPRTIFRWSCSFFSLLPWLADLLWNVSQIDSVPRDERQTYIQKWFMDAGVLLMGYEMYNRLITGTQGREPDPKGNPMRTWLLDPGPQLVVLDEVRDICGSSVMGDYHHLFVCGGGSGLEECEVSRVVLMEIAEFSRRWRELCRVMKGSKGLFMRVQRVMERRWLMGGLRSILVL